MCGVELCVSGGGGGWGKGAIGASVNNPQLTLPRHAFLRADTCQAKRHQDDSESLGKYPDNCVMCVKACTKSILIDSITQRKEDARKGYNSKTFEQRARENPRLCHGHCQAGEGCGVTTKSAWAMCARHDLLPPAVEVHAAGTGLAFSACGCSTCTGCGRREMRVWVRGCAMGTARLVRGVG